MFYEKFFYTENQWSALRNLEATYIRQPADGSFPMFSIFSGASQSVDMAKKSAYDFHCKTAMGEEPLPLSPFKGKVMLIVNTASQCGVTPQYDGLQKIYEKYKDQGLVILGVPSNDFGSQEMASNAEVAQFCARNYGVTFPMAAKEVVSGNAAHPCYLWAKKTLCFGTAPKWNFHKYLVHRKRELTNYFYSTTSPEAKNVVQAMESALSQSP